MENIENLENMNYEELESYLIDMGVSNNSLLKELLEYLDSDTLKDFYLTYIRNYDLCDYE